MSILYNLKEFLKEHIALKSQQQSVSIQEEYFEQIIKLFEYLGRDIISSQELQWKSQDNTLAQQILTQLVDLKDGKITEEQCLDEQLLKKTHQCYVNIDQVLFSFYKEIKGKGFLSVRIEILMENLDDFRKTGYTKNIFETKVAKGSNQSNSGQSTGYRKSSARIEDEVIDEEVVKDESTIIQEITDLV